jgi:hypothetical protein
VAAPINESEAIMAKSKERSMFMEVLRIEANKDLVHLAVMDNDPVTGERPEVDGELIEFTVPLSQFEPLMDDFAEAFKTKEYKRASVHRPA